MSSLLYFAEILQFMPKTTSCRLSDHWLVAQVNISSTRLLASVLLDFSLSVKAATSIFISGCGLAIPSNREGKSGFIYNLVKS